MCVTTASFYCIYLHFLLSLCICQMKVQYCVLFMLKPLECLGISLPSPFMLLWTTCVFNLVSMMGCYQQPGCHVPRVTTSTRIIASMCCPSAKG